MYQATILTLMISCPSDVSDMHPVIEEAVQTWNRQNSKFRNIFFVTTHWKRDCVPDDSQSAQNAINEQLTTKCDCLLALFWTRIGTPTDNAESGSIEEIELCQERGIHTKTLFCSKDIPQLQLDTIQFEKLKEFKLKKGEYYGQFKDKYDLKDSVASILNHFIEKMNIPLPQAMRPLGGSTQEYLEQDAKDALSEYAISMLMAAVVDSNGELIRNCNRDGLQVHTNGQILCNNDDDKRLHARAESAIIELLDRGFIKDTGYDGIVFKVTHKGFSFIDKLHNTKQNGIVPELSEEGKRFLVTASEDFHGQITCARTHKGPYFNSNGKDLNNAENPRERASAEAAMKELLFHELIEDRTGKRRNYELTAKGFELADKLKAEEK